ncbi:MAG: SpaA isopeptide-forming pilin-related protein [Coprobacillaceae bacterium]
MAEFIVIEPFLENGDILYIEIPDSDSTTQYYMEYQTRLEGELIGSKVYSNDALFHNDFTDDNTLHADVSVAHGGEYIGKQGIKNIDGSVSWNITINPSQSKLEDVIVKDKPSNKQIIDISTLTIYPTTITNKGDIAIDENANPLILNQDYTVSYYQDNNGEWEMDVHFINDYQTITKPYIINYGVTVITDQTPGTNVTLSNNVSILFNNVEIHEQDKGATITVAVSGGEGWIHATLGAIKFKKVDALTKEPLGNVVFELYYIHNGIKTLIGNQITTNEKGIIEFSSLPRGKYELVEISPIDGYNLLNPNPYIFNLDENTTNTTIEILNIPSEVVIYIKDRISNKPLSNAIFTIFKETNEGNYEKIDTITSDSEGKVVINALGEGNYYFQETVTPDGYKPNENTKYEFSISRNIGDGKLITSSITNTVDGVVYNDPSVIHFYKYDETGINGLSGAVFTLEKYNTITKGWELIRDNESVTSDENGLVEILGLGIGQYRISETKAPLGYAKDPTVKEFIVDDINIKQTEIIIDNYINYPSQFELIKLDSKTKKPLEGAVFQLWWKNPTTNILELVPIHRENRFISGSDGKVSIGGLSLGVEYYLVEIEAPSGYSLNSTPISIISNSEDTKDMIHYEFFNEPSMVVLEKVNEDNISLPGATFDLERFDESINKWIVLDTKTTDDNGIISIESLPVGEYRFIEKVAPNGYLLDEKPILFEIEKDNEGKITPISLSVLNHTNEIKLIKQDEKGNTLSGAEFVLEKQDIDGKWIRILEDVQLITDNNGMLTLQTIEEGNYRFTETTAPKGYQLDSTPIQFSVTRKDKEVIVIGPVINYPINKTPTTGDNMQLYTYLMLTIVSGIIVIATIRNKGNLKKTY